VDGVSGAPITDAKEILGGSREEVADLSAAGANNTVIIPPAQHASSLVRQLLASMLKPVRPTPSRRSRRSSSTSTSTTGPWWAFEFLWKPKDKRGVVEIDALTELMRQGQALVPKLQRMVTRDALFDIGADTVGLLVPGGGIAVKVARLAIHQRHKT
jgi:hypothetical protein